MSGYFDDHNNNNNHEDPFGNFHHTSSERSDWNRKILVMAIVSLTAVLVLVFALHIYARYVLRRQARRRFAVHQLSVTVAQAHHLHHDERDNNNNNTGLDPNIIATLPVFIFKRKGQQQQRHDDDDDGDDGCVVECAVCLNDLEDEEAVRMLPNCKHTFHVGCIDTWLASHATCPICRTKAEPVLRLIEPHPREAPSPTPNPNPIIIVEGTSSLSNGNDINNATNNKAISGSSVSRLSSFRRILSRDRSSSRRIQPSNTNHDDDGGDDDGDGDDHGVEQDLERQ